METEVEGGREVGERFLAALARRDWTALESCLSADVHFRALLPERVREHVTAPETVDRLRLWFGAADAFEVVDAHVDSVADRIRISYRVRCHDEDGWRLVEQHAYVDAVDGRITDLSLLCSGFRPAPAP